MECVPSSDILAVGATIFAALSGQLCDFWNPTSEHRLDAHTYITYWIDLEQQTQTIWSFILTLRFYIFFFFWFTTPWEKFIDNIYACRSPNKKHTQHPIAFGGLKSSLKVIHRLRSLSSYRSYIILNSYIRSFKCIHWLFISNKKIICHLRKATHQWFYLYMFWRSGAILRSRVCKNVTK